MRISRFLLDPRGRVKEAVVVDGGDLDELAALRMLVGDDDSEEGEPVADDEAGE
jgi:hypothetical protein